MFAIKIKRKTYRKLAKLNPEQKRNIETIIIILKMTPYPSKKLMFANSKATKTHTASEL